MSTTPTSPQPQNPQATATATPKWLETVRFDDQGLVPAIAQERSSGDILMFAWMNREALLQTVSFGEAVYFSRSRNRLWHKGEASGNTQTVHALRLDCDADVVLLSVTQNGHQPTVACHTGRHSCFYRLLEGDTTLSKVWRETEPVLQDPKLAYPKIAL